MTVKQAMTAKQKMFADAVVSGMTLSDAYRLAYSTANMKPETIWRCAVTASQHPKVSARILAATEKAQENAIWERSLAIRRAQDLNDWAYESLDKRRRPRVGKDERLKEGYIDEGADRSFWNSYDRLNKLLGIREGAEATEATFSTDFGMLLPAAYIDVHREVQNHAYTDFAFEGGRGSGKSSDIALELPSLMLKDPSYNAVVLRKVFNTCRKSVYPKLKWAISTLDLADDFHCALSPLEITYKPTGQKIYFLGLDDQEKVRSFACEVGYPAILWFEEFHQFSPADIRSVKQSLSRGGNIFWRFYSWNPPRSKSNWVNEWAKTEEAGKFVHHSDYTMVPVEWLGAQFVFDALELKAINELAYRHEYMGESVGTDGEVFQNLDIREITDDEIASLDYIRAGVDWGYNPDPLVFGQVGYNKKTKTVYILDEFFGRRLSDDEAVAKAIKIMSEPVLRASGETELDADGNPKTIYEPRIPTNRIYCDAAEPKSIATWCELGVRAIAAKKFKGSVDAGIKWLQTRKAIVIDPKRAPLSATEFYAYEYEEDADGALKTYPDKDNHSIDKARYALSELIAQRKEV